MKYSIYFLIQGGNVIYIGVTKDWVRRIKEHVNDGKKFDRFRTIECSDYDSALFYEKRWISKFKPRDNKNGFGPMSTKERMSLHISRKIMRMLRSRARSKGKTISFLIEDALQLTYGI